MSSRLLDYMSTTTWALHPAVMQRLTALVERHVNGAKLDAETIAAITANRAQSKVADREDEDYHLDRGVAVVPITGVLQKHASMVNNISGPSGTSYEAVRGAVMQAMRDPDVSAILLHIDSPGGVVDGVEDLSMDLTEARGTKPIYALADGMMASAALWIGSQAERVYATKGTNVGSVGIFASFTDTRRSDEAHGIDIRYLSSSDNKNATLSDQKLTSGQIDSINGQIKAEHRLFIEALARGRQVDEQTAAAWGTGDIYLATEAQALGLIDEVASYETVIKTISSSNEGAASMAAKNKTAAEPGASDALKKVAGKTTVTVETAPDLVSEEDGEDEEEEQDEEEEEEEAKSKSSKSEATLRARVIREERARARAIREMALDGQEDLVAQLIDNGTSADRAARELLKDAKAMKHARLSVLRREVVEEETVTVAATGKAAVEPWKRKAEAKWKADEELREEFLNDFDTYLSYEEARATGFVKEARR